MVPEAGPRKELLVVWIVDCSVVAKPASENVVAAAFVVPAVAVAIEVVVADGSVTVVRVAVGDDVVVEFVAGYEPVAAVVGGAVWTAEEGVDSGAVGTAEFDVEFVVATGSAIAGCVEFVAKVRDSVFGKIGVASATQVDQGYFEFQIAGIKSVAASRDA